MQVRLKVIQDNANLKQVKLLPVTVIGRGADCHLKIASSEVSRKHCRITVTYDAVLVEDLNSSNGTFLNEQRLTPSQAIPALPGAILAIGPAKFMVDYTPPVTLETMPTTVIKAADLAARAAASAIPVVSPPALSSSEASVAMRSAHPAPIDDTVMDRSPSEDTVSEPLAFPPVVSPTLPIPAPREIAAASNNELSLRAFGFETTAKPVNQASAAPTGEEPAAASGGGVKSLFGLFGRKAKPVSADSRPVVMDSAATTPPSSADEPSPPATESTPATPSDEKADPFDFLKGV